MTAISRPGPDRNGFRPPEDSGPLVSVPLRVGGRNGPLQDGDRHVWEIGNGPRKNYSALGALLSQEEDLFRNGTWGPGLIQTLPDGTTRLLLRAADLAPVLADRVDMVVEREGKTASELPAAPHLNAMLRSRVFLDWFRPVDTVTGTHLYHDDFSPVLPGYHDGSPGRRLLHVGPTPELADSLEAITAFLDVMDFATPADRTNAVAAALTVLLRHRWPGEKPVVLITATKSHAGKGTVAEFVRGCVDTCDLLYEHVDWPMQVQFQKQVARNPDLGVVVLDNVRLDSAGGRGKFIRSAFVESFVTSPEIKLASPAGGDALRLENQFVVIINTNDGSLSEDLINRALSIHLTPRGDIRDRRPAIGNPKLEYLPRHRSRIAAELRGLIERWRLAGCPPDDAARHPMSPWARTIGGILRFHGFEDFLANQRARKAGDDPLRRAVGLLGAARPGQALRPAEWARLVVEQGLARTLIPANERDTERGRERATGVVLRPLVGETFEVSTDEKAHVLRLEGGVRRWESGQNPHVRYRFEVLEVRELPVDPT